MASWLYERFPRINEMGYADVGIDDFVELATEKFGAEQAERIAAAYRFSEAGHAGQNRLDKVPYFEHPKTVAWLLLDFFDYPNPDAIIVALLHDIIEDSAVLSPERIRLNFGDDVLYGLQRISSKNFLSLEPPMSSGDYYLVLYEEAPAYVLAVKLTDRIHNLSTSDKVSFKTIVKMASEVKFYESLRNIMTFRSAGDPEFAACGNLEFWIGICYNDWFFRIAPGAQTILDKKGGLPVRGVGYD